VKDSDDVYEQDDIRDLGVHGAMLWSAAMRLSGKRNSDGIISERDLRDAGNLFSDLKFNPAKKAMLAVGRLHPHDHRCGECRGHIKAKPVPEGKYLLHAWWEHLLEGDGKDDEIKRWRNRRRKALNQPRLAPLREEVRRADRDLCRHCGVLTKDSPRHGDKSSGTVRTLDHIDPWGENEFENLMVLCKRCNGWKNDRTPDEAGMIIQPEGTTADQLRARGVTPKPISHHRTEPAEPTQEPAEPTFRPTRSQPNSRPFQPSGPTEAGLPREAGPGRLGDGPGAGSAGSPEPGAP
jgi:5-methylcytosine-specific restriction endonuclease McrA